MNVERLKKLVRGIVDADDMMEAMRILSDTGQTALGRECNALAARVQMLEGVHKEDNAGIENLRAEVARWQAIATRAVEALRTVLSRNGCAGCIPADRAPSYVRGKPLRLSVDEHEGDCVTIVALAAIADFDAAGTTTALDEMLESSKEMAVSFLHAQLLSPSVAGDDEVIAAHDARVAQEAREAALEAVHRAVMKRRDEVTESISRGKGEWPKPGYVQDEIWSNWQERRVTLSGVLDDVEEIRALANTPAQPRVPLADVLAIVREQPFYPDTNVGMRQQWVKDQIAEKVAALAKGAAPTVVHDDYREYLKAKAGEQAAVPCATCGGSGRIERIEATGLTSYHGSCPDCTKGAP